MTTEPADGLQPFLALEIGAEARTLEAQGRDICHLESGEPAVPPAPKVREAVRAMLDGPQGYTHFAGQRALREGLAQYYADQHGVAVDPDSMIVTMGSSAGFILAFTGGFRPGAAIAVTRPYYPGYINTLHGLGYRTVDIPVSAENGWRLTADAIAAAHAREPFDGLLFASPANPTGASVSRAAFAEMIATCARLGVRFISDEIYHGLDYSCPSVSALELTGDAIVINSFSKYYCMTGWRIGWMVLPDDLLKRVQALQQNMFISAPTLSQVAATVALRERDYCEAQKLHYLENRKLMTAGLASMGLPIGEADGAFYAYADVSRYTNDSLALAHRLLAAGVATAPGLDFDRVNGQRFLRLSYAGTREGIEKAMERMGKFFGA